MMESNSNFWDAAEDSGCLTFEASSSSKLNYSETPVLTFNNTRKRKINKLRTFDEYRKPSKQFTLTSDSPANFNISASSSNFMSSTLNESLSKSLENCNLSTPYLYSDSSSEEFDCKRKKYVDTPNYEPKTRSAPSSPLMHLEAEELRGKSYSDHYFHVTPRKKQGTGKLGSPECVELLYPTLTSTKSSPKIKTPEKLRDFLRKISSPAKKRLFEAEANNKDKSDHKVKKKIIKKVRYDPVSVFCVKNDFRHIMSEVFGYLSDKDLYSVSCVSKSWRRALNNDKTAQLRFHFYAQQTNLNKENICVRADFTRFISTPGSPVRDNFYKCTKIASTLLPNQSLLKCTICMSPAIKQKSVSQCQNPYCEYIYCVNCLSFSTTGPDDFVDKCNSSELKFSNSRRSRYSLYDKSNGGNDPPSFLFNDLINTPQTRYDSSGYFSGTDNTPVSKNAVVVQTKPKDTCIGPLTEHNNRYDRILYCRESRRSSLVPVVSPQKKYKNQEIIEPPSPPRTRVVACSKQSKKNLRRLQL